MNRSQLYELLSSMPELPHSVEGEEFNIEHSKMVAWFLSHPGVKVAAARFMMNSRRLKYDAATKCWHGVPPKEPGKPGRPRKHPLPAEDLD